MIRRPDASAAVVLVCEHASPRMPKALGDLGLDAEALSSHIAWDPGALAVADLLSDQLDATLVAQAFSRLAYDCNRPPDSPFSVPAKSEIYDIPGNLRLGADERAERADAIYHPFRSALAEVLGRRAAADGPPVLVTIHTFTPVYFGKPREVEIGILHDSDRRFADAMLDSMAGDAGGFRIERNQPYGPADGVTHTLLEHALPAGLLNVMIEIRNDLVSTEADQAAMAGYLARHIAAALSALADVASHAERGS
ncbi:putative N-formylglutamate amidohydrolase [Hoeflea marina]|uniref:Putative N-formylglutamate amidohydrolase n=1 Tax=Hoeflea marina TaxID=274592 RepID=A0A317PGG0_9HYPH|nr:N-formylglutamate amidohydrolase [Hoeflea marina]PWV98222.1 putative N-formylglutamate amidohydrolase [Hoeflea marina]